MAQKSTKRKKLTRRARRAAGITKPKSTGGGAPRPTEPVAIRVEVPDQPAPPAPVQTTAVRFSDTSRSRTPSGIDESVAAHEYPAIRRDLRKLAVTVVFFAAVIAALAIIGNQTNIVTDLGKQLFTLWR